MEGGRQDPSTRKIPEGGITFYWVYMRKFCGYQVEGELVMMAGKNNKNAICPLLLSLLVL